MKEPAIRETAKKQDPDEIADLHQNKSSFRWIILIPFVIFLGVLAAVVRHSEPSATLAPIEKVKPVKQKEVTVTGGGESSIKKMIRNNIRLYVKAACNEYDHRRLGGISDLTISVNNPTDYTLDKVQVKIIYIKANGGIYETKYEDFLAVKPNTKITHKIPDTKRGTSINYEITTIKSKALGLN